MLELAEVHNLEAPLRHFSAAAGINIEKVRVTECEEVTCLIRATFLPAHGCDDLQSCIHDAYVKYDDP